MKEQEQDNLFVILTHLQQDLSRLFEKRMGMSFSRMMLIHELWHAGELSQTELAQRLGMEGPLVSRFVKQMEASGLLNRRVDPKDNRFTLVSLAPGSQKILQDADELGTSFETDLLHDISEQDRQQVIQTMKQIQSNIDRL